MKTVKLSRVYAENQVCDNASLLFQINENLKELVRIEKDRYYREMMQEIREHERKVHDKPRYQ